MIATAACPAAPYPATPYPAAPRLWCIGGTDPSGMAGLAADQATAQDLASALMLTAPVCLVASCLTAQNQTQVLQVQPVGTAFLLSQLDSLDAQLPEVIKIGLLPDQATLEALAARLSVYKQQKPQLWLIWDPVLAASNGASLSSITDPRPLLALVDVLTPNRMELLALAAMVAADQASEKGLLTADKISIRRETANDGASTTEPANNTVNNTVNSAPANGALTNDDLMQSAVAQLLGAGVSAIWCKDGHGTAPEELCEQLYLRSVKAIKQLPHRFDFPTDNAALDDAALDDRAADHVAILAWHDATRKGLASSHTEPCSLAQNTHGTVPSLVPVLVPELAPVLTLRQPRQAAVLRGTGCSFATALSCFLLAPRLLPDALLLASAYLQQAFRAASQSFGEQSEPALADVSAQFQSVQFQPAPPQTTPSIYLGSPSNAFAQRLPRLGMPQLTNCQFEVQCDRVLIELGFPANVTGFLSGNELRPDKAPQPDPAPWSYSAPHPNREHRPNREPQSNSAPAPGLPPLTGLRNTASFAPLTRPIGIYPIAGSLAQLEQLAMAGVSTLQLRLKQPASAHELRLQLQAAIALGQRLQLQLFINDYWQLALELGAYGVHLGQADVAQADLRLIAGSGLRLGVSTHGELELYQALQLRPSYVALGHVFDTPTKHMPSIAQGLQRITQQAQWCQAAQIPTVAIGGLDARHIPAIKAAGVSGMAVVRAVADQPTKACQHLQQLWEEA